MPTITPMLWFNDNVEQAMDFYAAIFPDFEAGAISRKTAANNGSVGSILVAEFHMCGQKFLALNGGPKYRFTEAISLVVHCQTQAEIDRFWSKLTDGGEEIQCGWLKDRFGLFWQVTPTIIPELLRGDPQRAKRVMMAVYGMKKLDIAALQRAADG